MGTKRINPGDAWGKYGICKKKNEAMRMERIIRWGILGPGRISDTFARELSFAPDARIVAVGSRSLERAEAFADHYQAQRAYGSYEELALDPDVDIIYIGTPHPMHKENALACLRAGKAVLCEKAFTMNADELKELIDAAKENKVFMMEAMWTRFLPTIAKVREWVGSGVIGEIGMVDLRFGNRSLWDPSSRLFDPALGGGTLLDVGIYCISFASMVLGRQPSTIHSLVNIGTTGVDEVFTALFGYEHGPMASIMAAHRLKSKNEAVILGSKGEIRVPDFWKAKSAILTVHGESEENYVDTMEPRGYAYEALEAMQCVRDGKLESAIMPLSESLAIMETMDRLRADWGLRYPSESIGG
jgi:dihydrodiol dehydrogenase / D-xylose 1-dehydrogenase (NADP)